MGIGFSSLHIVEKQIESSNLFSSRAILTVSLGSFGIAQASADVLTKEAGLVGLTKNTDYLNSELEFGKKYLFAGFIFGIFLRKNKKYCSGYV